MNPLSFAYLLKRLAKRFTERAIRQTTARGLGLCAIAIHSDAKALKFLSELFAAERCTLRAFWIELHVCMGFDLTWTRYRVITLGSPLCHVTIVPRVQPPMAALAMAF